MLEEVRMLALIWNFRCFFLRYFLCVYNHWVSRAKAKIITLWHVFFKGIPPSFPIYPSYWSDIYWVLRLTWLSWKQLGFSLNFCRVLLKVSPFLNELNELRQPFKRVAGPFHLLVNWFSYCVSDGSWDYFGGHDSQNFVMFHRLYFVKLR